MEDSAAGIDMISNLTDDLLCRILSLLPIKDAFSTTILSKRWTPLFKSLTHLFFDDESVRDKDSLIHFLRFIETVTLSTKLIKTFHLKCCSIHWRDTSLPFDRWIEKHPVENLQVSTFHGDIFLPPNIFTFSTLVVLSLSGLKVIGITSVDLPLLQTLQLNDVYFENKENFNNLLSGSPNITDLRASCIYNLEEEEEEEGVRHSTEWFKTLSNLITADIINVDPFDVLFRAISNVKILMLRVMIRLPEINSYYGGFPVFQNLIDLNLCLYIPHHLNQVIEVLRYCPKLQILSISKIVLYNLQSDIENPSINWKHSSSVPECISSHLISCTLNYEGYTDELQFTRYILQNARLLEVMNVNIKLSSYSSLNRVALEELTSCPTISPKCKLSINSRYLKENRIVSSYK